MDKNVKNNQGMKWLIVIVISAIFAAACVVSMIRGAETDRELATVFIVIAGLVWGARIVDSLKKIK